MRIDASLLDRIKNNDPTLKTLDLARKELNDGDMQQLIEDLVTNTTLTTLNLYKNKISSKTR